MLSDDRQGLFFLRPGFLWRLGFFLLIASLAGCGSKTLERMDVFDGQQAYQDVETQVMLGPRWTGSAAHAQTLIWMEKSLQDYGWQTEVQKAEIEGQTVHNLIARNGEEGPWIVLGAHYDTRLFADEDISPEKHSEHVLGANDGASGVAVLLELARALPKDIGKNVWLVFFDAEDNGEIDGWDWLLGSKAFVNSLEEYPEAAIIVDMVGDADLTIFTERNSDETLTNEIWRTAAKLGYQDVFISAPKYSMLDDHTPFLEAGIPAVDIIDFDYPYWHTTEDTLDKVSADSLEAVGRTLLAWLLEP